MPITKPKKNEKKNTYISRCIRSLAKTDPKMPSKQRVAICHSTWRKSKGKQSDDEEVTIKVFNGNTILYEETLKTKHLIERLQSYYGDKDMAGTENIDFATVKDDENFLQWARNGILDPKLLLDALKTVDRPDVISDDEWKSARNFLLNTAEAYIKVVMGEQ